MVVIRLIGFLNFDREVLYLLDVQLQFKINSFQLLIMLNKIGVEAFDSDRDDQDDLDEEKMIRTELMNISTKQPEVS